MSEALFPLSSIHVGERYRKDLGDIDALAASIKAVGLLHAIVATNSPEGTLHLVAGQRRLEACRLLGWERIPVRVLRIEDLIRAERDENEVRMPFSPSEAVAIAAALRPIEQAAARERMSVGGKGGQLDHPSRAEDRIADAVGMSRNTLAKAEAVVEAAEADPVLAPLVEHMDETGKVEPAHRALKALPPDPTPEQVHAAIASREAALPPEHIAQERALDAQVTWLDSWAAIRKAINRSPASTVAVLEREDIDDLSDQIAYVRAWLDEVEAAMRDAQRPRLVTGGVA